MKLLWFRISCILTFAAVSQVSAGSLQPDSTIVRRSHVGRNMLLGNLVVGTGTYFYFENTWGAPDGRFHFKNELHDNVAFTDEISHFYAGYKLTDGFRWLFGALKMPEEKRLPYAALQAAIILTLVEIPMDAFNPDQGFGVSDIVLDYGGIGAALLKQKYPNQFDMKLSVKRAPWKFDNKFLAGKGEEFANFVWWLTYTPQVVSVGAGYSVGYDARGDVHSEYYLGVGTTLYDVLHFVKPRLADQVKALDCYFINIHLKLD